MAPTDVEDKIKEKYKPCPFDEDDIALLKTYGLGPYSHSIKKLENFSIKKLEKKNKTKKINDLSGIKESDTGLAAPSSIKNN